MADDVDENSPILKGSLLPVTIEDVLPDLLVVCLKHGAKVYRGILMDSVKRDMPYGVNFSLNKLKKGYEPPKKDNSGAIAEVNVSNPPEVSALINRHTYSLDSKAVGPRLLSPPRIDIVRPLRDKNIRNMRLRPRQVLCSKCKQGIHDTKVQENLKEKVQKESESTQTVEPIPEIRYDTRKRRQLTAAVSLEDENTPKKSKRLCNANTSKSSPVIKISFAGPMGHGTVVEIPRKPNIPQLSDSEEGKNSPALHKSTNRTQHEEYRLRKTQKRIDKLKCKDDTDLESISSESKVPPVTVVRRKKSKRTKHKRKHRHRNGKRHNSGQSEGNESMKENDSVKTPIILDEGEESVVDGMVMYAGEEDEDDDDDNDDDSDSLSLHRYLEDPDDREGIIVLSPRHNFMLDTGNMKLGTPNKQYDSNTETSQELDLDFKDFFSNKPGINDSDTENNLSDTQFEVNSEDQENLDADFNSDFAATADGRGTPTIRPLMMRIQNRRVNKVLLDDGRAIKNGDVIWGKIHGFPWWPGKVMSISESLKDSGIIINQTAQISWFASSTMSHMACAELYPFLQDFKLRYNKKKKGSYKMAVKQATIVAHRVAESDGQTMTHRVAESEGQSMTPPEFADVDIDALDP